MYARRFSHGNTGDSEWDGFLSVLRAWLAVDHNEDGTHHVPVLPEAVPLGAIVMWGSNTAPTNWLLCNGDAVSRTVYQGLFAIISTTYGAGDGSTTFNLPDLRQRFPLGKAASGTGATLGSTGGSIDHTHTFSSGTTGAGGGHTHTASGSTNTTGAHDHFDFVGNTGFNSTGETVQSGSGVTVAALTHSHNGGNLTTNSQGDHSHTVSVSVDSASDHTHSLGSGSTAAENPSFVTVNFIILAGV